MIIVFFSLVFTQVNNLFGQSSLIKGYYEIFFYESILPPLDTGKINGSYTASIFVLDNIKDTLMGPYKGSAYPNSYSKTKKIDNYRTNHGRVKSGCYKFCYSKDDVSDNILMLLNEYNQYKVECVMPDECIDYKYKVGIRVGGKDKGLPSSRNSNGNLTIAPIHEKKFFSIFDKSYFPETILGVITVEYVNEAQLVKLASELKDKFR